MSTVKDKLKQKAKRLMLKAAITLSVSGGITGAAAQNIQNQDRSNDVIEQGYNARHIEKDVPAFFGEKPIKMSKDQIWRMVQTADLDETQMDYFATEYAKLVKSPQGLTDKNFKWMLEKGVDGDILSQRQAEIMENKAIEYNVPVKAPDEQIIEDGVRPGEENVAMRGTFINNVEYDSGSGVKGQNLNYSFDKEGKLNIQYDGLVDLQGLMPSLVQQSDGTYRCGATTGIERARVISQEKSALSQVVIENMVYQDLLMKKHNNEKLGGAEQTFMKQHVQDLQKHGLSMGKKGLQKLDVTQMQMQQQMNTVR